MQSGAKASGALSRRAEKRGAERGFVTLYQKELADHFRSARYKLLFALLTLISLASLFGAFDGLMNAQTSEYIFLSMYTTSGNSIPSFASFLAYLAPLVGLALGFDAINRERTQGTLNRLVSQPIHRDAVISAKFLAGATAIALLIFSQGVLVGGVGLTVIGVPPSSEELLRLGSYLLLTVFYTMLWLGLSMLFSVLCKHAATSALIVIALWIYFTVFSSMVSSVVANLCYPLDGIQGYYNTLSNYELQLAFERVSPYYLYSEAATTLLNPDVRFIGFTTTDALSGALAGTLSFGQSALLVWPHLVCMVALVLLAFAVAYIVFMRQEIRA
ncbi:MAG TPA: ABC transporter permease [Candidatus Pullichristensenella excrementigallinarum]|uniref:ABC transporter permease n=1 Tax=Candidatus Pullichristensenella excrementigallinarum TaxID=2840907 RepID=A0A9D1IBE9_9FIRM|nr:ABC transporter permease [Candidatus Pullichristensenella excrementigallinarum]